MGRRIAVACVALLLLAAVPGDADRRNACRDILIGLGGVLWYEEKLADC